MQAKLHWRHAIVASTCRHIPADGFKRGQILWVRARGIAGTVKGCWSAPVEVVVS